MSTDKHFNEPGVMPDALRDRKGTDLPATRMMFVVIAILAAVGAVVAVLFELMVD